MTVMAYGASKQRLAIRLLPPTEQSFGEKGRLSWTEKVSPCKAVEIDKRKPTGHRNGAIYY